MAVDIAEQEKRGIWRWYLCEALAVCEDCGARASKGNPVVTLFRGDPDHRHEFSIHINCWNAQVKDLVDGR